MVLGGGWLVDSHWFLGMVLEFSCLPYPHNNLHSVVLFFLYNRLPINRLMERLFEVYSQKFQLHYLFIWKLAIGQHIGRTSLIIIPFFMKN